MRASKNWRLLPKHAKVGDYKNIISPQYASQYGEYAFKVLTGEPYQFSTVLDYFLDYLEKHGEWVKKTSLKVDAGIEGYHPRVVASGLIRLEYISNVGRKWENGDTHYKFYEERTDGFDELNQSALDEAYREDQRLRRAEAEA